MADDDQQQYDNYNSNGEEGGEYGDDNVWSQLTQKDDRTCRVYDGDDLFTTLVQVFLAIAALASLYLKRMKEVPRRTFQTWALDVGKQGIGACYAHVCNMAIAAILSQALDGETALQDECAWYGLSYLIDTTLGLVLAIMCLRIQDYFAGKYQWESLLNSGVYHGENACKHWTAQTLSWLLILTVVKIFIFYFMLIFKDVLAFFGAIMFAPLQINIRFELLFVMIFFPGFLNVIYFWIADSYLKADSQNEHAFEAKEDKEMSLISEEDKNAQAQADGDMAAMSGRSQQGQAIAADKSNFDWGREMKRHTEFMSTYLPAWSVFGKQPSADADDLVTEPGASDGTTA